jgi:DNA-directed RNA polymerase specialized sigma24 family protein
MMELPFVVLLFYTTLDSPSNRVWHISPEEQKLITALFFNDKSEHQMSRETGVPQRTIHDRKVKILTKLRKLMKK